MELNISCPTLNQSYEYIIGDPALLISVDGCKFGYDCPDIDVITSVTLDDDKSLPSAIFKFIPD